MVGELLHVRVPLPQWGNYGHRECIAQPVAQSVHESLILVKGGSVGFLQAESQSPCVLFPCRFHLPPMGDASVPTPLLTSPAPTNGPICPKNLLVKDFAGE